jgi:hypothetical protein
MSKHLCILVSALTLAIGIVLGILLDRSVLAKPQKIEIEMPQFDKPADSQVGDFPFLHELGIPLERSVDADKKRVETDTRLLGATENDLKTAQAKISYLGNQLRPIRNVVFTSDANKLSLDLFYDVQREKYNNDEKREAHLQVLRELPATANGPIPISSRIFAVSPREFADILEAVKPVLTKEGVAEDSDFLAFVVIYKKDDKFRGQEFRIGSDFAEDFYLKLRGALDRENTAGRKIVTSQFHSALGSGRKSKE